CARLSPAATTSAYFDFW
nr:immunoglobulin heavy chain junction region [Macaca mulatta]MOY22265.1 immunoglobulin heavy chain junction region [Macaca mulatta]MOY22450.1 immunoglobulin heavy chain junction region [Macaca mulatta]MOY22642.1 immunoglobulin heavy chain junction region [Macaca mulatta]MOY22674.1 immunoglobulin heavy chain junction region [Macaca mulatta]